MTDMTSKEIHEVIDRAMKTIAARFDRRFSDGSAPPESELAEEPRPFDRTA